MENHQNGPILIDLDHNTWENHLNKVGFWLGNTLMSQVAFYQLTTETINKIQHPHIRRSLQEMSVKAVDHIRNAEKLFEKIGRNPSYFTNYGAVSISYFKQTISQIKGMLGGAQGNWQMLHQLFLTNMNAISSFAVTEQFGLTLGLPEITHITMPIIHQKETDQLVLKEYLLEMASLSIIYNQSV